MTERSIGEPILADLTDTERLCGSWALVSWERFRGGAFLEYPLGSAPVGLLTYDPAGFMQVQMVARARSLPTFRNPRDAAHASLRDQQPPPAQALELTRTYQSFAGYAGRFEVDEASQVIRHHLWTGIDPRLVAAVQERLYRFVDDDTLILRIRPYPVEGVAHHDVILWRRATAATLRDADVDRRPISGSDVGT